MIDQEISTDSNLLSLERTHMAIERIYYSVLRTGLAIAAAGTIIVRILGEQWPDWLKFFIVRRVYRGGDNYDAASIPKGCQQLKN